ncbi:MAG: carboxypeptidase-like regulatory domain-containing protein, partial [Cloacibacterium caeni]
FSVGFVRLENQMCLNVRWRSGVSYNVSIQGGKDEIFIGNGSVLIPEITTGNYNFRISAEGYDDGFLNDINVVPNQNLTFSIGLNKSAKQI